MTTSLVPVTDPGSWTSPRLPADPFAGPSSGLTDADATRIGAAMIAAHADSTRAVYGYAWRAWERWCGTRGIAPLPAGPLAICAYLTERADQGASVATLDLACSAIAHRHRRHGLTDPIGHEPVRQARRGLRRTLGTAPRRQARPLGIPEIRRIVCCIDRTTAKGARDAALILLGFAAALRRSELTALTPADVELKPGGLLLTVRRSKTNPEGRGQIVAVAHGQHAVTGPVAAVAAWRTVRGSAPAPLFTSLRDRQVTLEPISGEAVAAVAARGRVQPSP